MDTSASDGDAQREAARGRTAGGPGNETPPAPTDSVPEITYSVPPGEVCPTCGHRQAKTPKQRHAEWRARRDD